MEGIKFRVWCMTNNEWEKDDVALTQDGRVIQNKNGRYLFLSPENHIVEFYTGLKDKNGVEIYKGDILRYRAYSNLGYENFKINVVEYGETGDSDDYFHHKHYEYIVGADSLADVADGDYEGFECEVMGNIHENQELV